MNIRRALVSVYDKDGAAAFARGLSQRGVEIVSTGGTYRLLSEAGVPVGSVSEATGFPELLDGRVKTLHPAIHAGILARRPLPDDMAQLERHGVKPIDLVAVNLYPFERVAASPDATLNDVLENIDIGGPTMIRAAAKNYRDVVVVVNPRRYDEVIERMDRGELTLSFRESLAREAFEHTAAYDKAIHAFFCGRAQTGGNVT